MVSIKEFAIENMVSESIVYRHIRNHKEELGENVQRVHGRTWLTDEGASFIKSLMTQQTVVREKANDVVKNLERELRAAQAETKAQAQIIKSLELDLKKNDDEKKLLENGKKDLEGKLKSAEDENHLLKQQIECMKNSNIWQRIRGWKK